MPNISAETRNSVLIFCLTTVSTYLLIKGWRRFRDSAKQGVLRLVIYPIKSVTGIEVPQLEVIPTGVRYNGIHDRSLMLLNEHNNLISLRTKPTLALIVPSFEGATICLEAPGMEVLKLPPISPSELTSNRYFDFKLWDEPVQGVEYSPKATEWFSRFLKSEAKLVHFLPGSMQFRKTYMHTEMELFQDPAYPIVYQDESAVSLANQSSIDDLNSKLVAKNQVSFRNFRPNILVRVPGPFSEDSWPDFSVGQVNFSLAKPCHRCTTTLVAPGKGVKNPDLEPLETLRTFRIRDEWRHLYQNSPIFGLSLIPKSTGVIRVGEQVCLHK